MEIQVLLLANFFVLATSLITLIAIAWTYPQVRETRWFALAYAFGTAAAGTMLLHDRLPHGLPEVIGNVFVMLCYAFCHRAVLEFAGLPSKRMVLPFSLALCCGLGMFLYTVVAPDTLMRIVLVSAMVALQASNTGFTLLRHHEPGLTRACATLAVQLLVVAFCMVVRGLLTLRSGADVIYLTTHSWIQLGGMMVFLVSSASIPLGFFWMTTARERMHLEESARRDSLTGLLNRRALEAEMERELSRHRRHRAPLAAVMLDLDYFKKLNDTHGHDVGDAALQSVAGILARDCRSIDLVARLGGEEFLLVVPETPLAGAVELAERLREKLASSPLQLDTRSIRFTASFGVASCDPQTESAELLIKRCDQAMYQAKADGRNRVCVAPAPCHAKGASQLCH